MVKRVLKRIGNTLWLDGKHSFELKPDNCNVRVVGFGKAVGGMLGPVLDLLEDNNNKTHLIEAAMIIPSGCAASVTKCDDKIEWFFGAADNLPDENAMIGAKRVVKVAEQATEMELLIVLISGGGSALSPLPTQDITLEEKLQATKILSRNGANINELNTVRKHLSLIKGGQLAKYAYPATVFALILSDVIDSPLDIISSGPTVPDSSTFADCLAIVQSKNVASLLPSSVLEHLQRGISGQIEETPKENAIFNRVFNAIMGNNKIACEAARDAATRQGFNAFIVSESLQGEARIVGRKLADLGLKLSIFLDGQVDGACPNLSDYFENVPNISFSREGPLCLIFGGETTVSVKGNGKGGRAQELALSAAMHLLQEDEDGNVLVFAAGTDGQDGPTDAAGAFGDRCTLTQQQLDSVATAALANNDAYPLLQDCNALLKTGKTGTNVMDIYLVMVQKR